MNLARYQSFLPARPPSGRLFVLTPALLAGTALVVLGVLYAIDLDAPITVAGPKAEGFLPRPSGAVALIAGGPANDEPAPEALRFGPNPIDLDPALAEVTAAGLRLPKTTPEGVTPLERYAHDGHAPGYALVLLVDQLGLSRTLSAAAVALPDRTGLVFSPYARDTEEWHAFSRSHGHEALLELPLSPEQPAFDDTGPLALNPTDSAEKLLSALHRVLDRGAGYIAVVVRSGGFGDAPEAFVPVAEELAFRGLGLIEAGDSRLEAVALAAGLPYLSVIDLGSGLLDSIELREALERAELLAAERERPVAVLVTPGIETFDTLEEWLNGFEARGGSLVPAGAVLKSTLPRSETALGKALDEG